MTSFAQSPSPTPNPDLPQDTLQTVAALAQRLVQALDAAIAQAGNGVMAPCQIWLEPLTASVGQVVAPVANHPFMQGLTLVPGLRWLLAALGQVNVDQVRQGVDDLRRQVVEILGHIGMLRLAAGFIDHQGTVHQRLGF